MRIATRFEKLTRSVEAIIPLACVRNLLEEIFFRQPLVGLRKRRLCTCLAMRTSSVTE
ncbi:hypothetical protein SAMN05216295_12256 [Pseudomonas luteola]|nr:hypothetical protein SAMN05216295_12256 [Pseudomonas zeshuii]